MSLIRKIWNAIRPAIVQPDPEEQPAIIHLPNGWRFEKCTTFGGYTGRVLVSPQGRQHALTTRHRWVIPPLPN